MKDWKEKIAKLIPHDKALHFLFGVLICFIFGLLVSPFIALGLTLIIAVMNEVTDDPFDWKDVFYTAGGALIIFLTLVL